MSQINNYVQVIHADWVRTFICGDIHGHRERFIKALDKLGFNYESDKVICTGDLVDHGDDNLGVVRLLDEPWFLSVRGNHDQMCMDGMSNTKAKQIHKDDENGGAWFYELKKETQQYVFDKFSDLPYAIELHAWGKVVGIMHGELAVNDWEVMKEKFISTVDTDEVNRFTNDIIWKRERIETMGQAPYSKVKNIDAVFFGHTIVDEPTVVNGNCHFIDTGLYKTGDITFAILDGVAPIKIKTVKGKKPK